MLPASFNFRLKIILLRMKTGFFILMILFLDSFAFTQDSIKRPIFPKPQADTSNHQKVQAKIIDGDTIPVIDVNPIVIFPQIDFKNSKELMRFDRLVYNVRIVYPFAKLAGEKLREYKHKLDSIPNERARKAFIKKAEKELEAQFGDQIKALTFSQGKVLIKLIYRETGNSSYDIVKELRGSFSAFIWQTMARLFGYDLKIRYDPEGDDKAIEHIVQMIEAGAI